MRTRGTFSEACADTQYAMIGSDSIDDETGAEIGSPVADLLFRG
jgi:hypothetical protein